MGLGLGLGLGQPPTPEVSVEEYREDPADSFSRIAEMMQPPGGAIPLPFGNPLVRENQDQLGWKEQNACHKQDLIS